jgi:hypothetical protein
LLVSMLVTTGHVALTQMWRGVSARAKLAGSTPGEVEALQRAEAMQVVADVAGQPEQASLRRQEVQP